MRKTEPETDRERDCDCDKQYTPKQRRSKQFSI
jgi:hypothetical protein